MEDMVRFSRRFWRNHLDRLQEDQIAKWAREDRSQIRKSPGRQRKREIMESQTSKSQEMQWTTLVSSVIQSIHESSKICPYTHISNHESHFIRCSVIHFFPYKSTENTQNFAVLTLTERRFSTNFSCHSCKIDFIVEIGKLMSL